MIGSSLIPARLGIELNYQNANMIIQRLGCVSVGACVHWVVQSAAVLHPCSCDSATAARFNLFSFLTLAEHLPKAQCSSRIQSSLNCLTDHGQTLCSSLLSSPSSAEYSEYTLSGALLRSYPGFQQARNNRRWVYVLCSVGKSLSACFVLPNVEQRWATD